MSMNVPFTFTPGEKVVTVLFFDHTAKLGGGEIALFHLLTHLDKEKFHPVLVLGEEGPLGEKAREAGIETAVIPLPDHVANTRKDSLGAGSLLKIKSIFASLGYSRKLSHFIKSRKADIVHTNSLKSDLIGGIAARLARVPVVWHIRDRIENDYLPGPVVLAFRWLCRVIPDFVVANSAATMETVHLPGRKHRAVVHSGYAFINETSALVHDGVEPRAAAAAKPSSDTFLLGLVGRISRWKGQHIFITAAATVRERYPSARFQIIGSPMFGEEAYEAEIRELTRSLGLEDVVEFLGFRTDVPQLMEELDLLVHASITGEPFGQVITEAMVVGKPVVATRGGGVPEIVQDGVTGLLVPMGDAPAMAAAICELLADPDRASRMGAEGRARVLRHFTVRGTARRLESVFLKILTRTSDARPEGAVRKTQAQTT
jgi:glycosyltransferase involved in cell wall biosynthesis